MHDHPFIAGMGLGMLAGAAVGVSMVRNEKALKRKAKRAAHSVSDLVEEATGTIVQKLPR